MKDWNDLYGERGILQKNINLRVIEAIKFLKDHGTKNVLDLGCGTGRYTIFLAKEGFKVYACDLSEKAIEIAKKGLPGVIFKKCEMTELAYEDGFFDAVICNQVIQHGMMDDIMKAVSEIERVLKKDGILFLATISINHPKFKTGNEIEPGTKENTEKIDGDMMHHFFTREEIDDLFRNFEIIKLDEFEVPSELSGRSAHWEILARKK